MSNFRRDFQEYKGSQNNQSFDDEIIEQYVSQ